MKSAIIIDFTTYQNQQTTPSETKDNNHCSDELANAIQALILEMRNPLKQTG